MERNKLKFTHAAARAVAAAALVATIAFGSGPAIAAKASDADRVEARIKDMHAKLKITQARSEHAKTMTAVDDLKSYAEITDAHADGIKKFTPVFATLYAEMPDAQKKEADTLFRHGTRKMSKSK